jgi:hypothetical protein
MANKVALIEVLVVIMKTAFKKGLPVADQQKLWHLLVWRYFDSIVRKFNQTFPSITI